MKQTHRTNYRVEVTPEAPYMWLDVTGEKLHRAWMDACRELQQQIQRHCDQIHGISIEYDTVETCSHCGCAWEDKPECCEEAIKEWDPDYGKEEPVRTPVGNFTNADLIDLREKLNQINQEP
jgi:hypothetical protein